MIELPSNVIEAERFIDAMALDGGSIGSNDWSRPSTPSAATI